MVQGWSAFGDDDSKMDGKGTYLLGTLVESSLIFLSLTNTARMAPRLLAYYSLRGTGYKMVRGEDILVFPIMERSRAVWMSAITPMRKIE
jgi:hypothetical protein